MSVKILFIQNFRCCRPRGPHRQLCADPPRRCNANREYTQVRHILACYRQSGHGQISRRERLDRDLPFRAAPPAVTPLGHRRKPRGWGTHSPVNPGSCRMIAKFDILQVGHVAWKNIGYGGNGDRRYGNAFLFAEPAKSRSWRKSPARTIMAHSEWRGVVSSAKAPGALRTRRRWPVRRAVDQKNGSGRAYNVRRIRCGGLALHGDRSSQVKIIRERFGDGFRPRNPV